MLEFLKELACHCKSLAYDCSFFLSSCAAKVEDFLKQDRLLYPHCRYYIREMRIHVYTQLLESYRSLTLQYMANAFGVSEEFIDK